MESIDRIVAENIVWRRKNLGLSQKKLAEIAKINAITLNRIEKLKQPAGRASVEALATALGCAVEDLYKTESAEAPTPTVEHLLKAMAEQQKEIEALRAEIERLKSGAHAPASTANTPAADTGEQQRLREDLDLLHRSAERGRYYEEQDRLEQAQRDRDTKKK